MARYRFRSQIGILLSFVLESLVSKKAKSHCLSQKRNFKKAGLLGIPKSITSFMTIVLASFGWKILRVICITAAYKPLVWCGNAAACLLPKNCEKFASVWQKNFCPQARRLFPMLQSDADIRQGRVLKRRSRIWSV